jgi:hypothetical protein
MEPLSLQDTIYDALYDDEDEPESGERTERKS